MYKDFDEMFRAAQAAPRRTIAVAAAAEEHIIQLTGEIAKTDLCSVILVDDEQKLRSLAAENGVSLEGVRIVDQPDPARAALDAVSLVSGGEADVFVKGRLNTSDFLRAVLNKEHGLRRKDRPGGRLSTLTCYDVPGMKKLFFITDGGMNIAPDLNAKADILRNAVETLHAFGIERPNVALLSANEKVSAEMQSSVDAAALCEMAARGELPEAVYEGPMAFDVIMRPEAARTKGIVSKVSGDVDLILVPNIDTGNALGKAIGYFAHGQAAVLMIGATHPVVMTSRAAPVKAKLNAVAFALLCCSKL